MLVVDVEASGTDYSKHSIVSVGALDFANPKNRFYEECRIWDGAHIMDGALTVNGFTKAQITRGRMLLSCFSMYPEQASTSSG